MAIMQTIPEYGRKFCLQTSIHGLNHIAAPGRHWLERLLWVGIVAVAVWGVVDISRGQLQRYLENPTVVTLERDYRTWTNTLPAITICDQNRVDNASLAKTIKSTWNVEPSDAEYEYYARFVAAVANSDIYRLQDYDEFKNDTRLHVDLLDLVVQVTPEMQVKTGSSERIAPAWAPVMTEAGVCYTANSVAIADVTVNSSNQTAPLAPYTCNYSAQGCYLFFEVYYRIIDYYVHSPYDIAEVVANPSWIFPSLSRFTVLSSMETRAGRGVRELPPQRRRCLYTHEPTSPGRKVYSTHTCRRSCRSRLTVELCGCKPFYYFYEGFTAREPMCNASGMWCLAQRAHELATFGGFHCPCSQQCVDSVYKRLSTTDQILDGPLKKRAAVKLTLQAPRTRYNREIVFHFQDLVVSFGGAAGLFLGASLVSCVELVYFFFDGFNKKNPQRSATATGTPRPCEARIRELTDILREIHTETD